MNSLDNSLHGLSGAYVVDALDDLERARFEHHLATCADCRAEVEELSETTALLSDLTATTPPPALRDRVLAEIKTVRPLPPQPAESPVLAAPTRRRRAPMFAAAAAALAIVAGGAVAIDHPWQGTSQVQLSTADRVLSAKDAQHVSLTLKGGAKATVTRSVSLDRAVIVTSKMPPAPTGKVYEIWLQDSSGNMTPAGLMAGGTDQTIVLNGDARDSTAAAITAEPAGGSQQPTDAPIAFFKFQAKA